MPEWAGEAARRELAPKGRFYGAHEFCNCLNSFFFFFCYALFSFIPLKGDYYLRIGLHDAVDNAELLYPRPGLRRARGGDDFSRQPLFPRGARDRAADQPEADQRDSLE